MEALARCLSYEGGGPLSIRLHELLVKVSRDLAVVWFRKQLVGKVGSELDRVLKQKVALESCEVPLTQQTSKQVEQALCRYYVATCKAFHLPANLSISVDKARVGQKGLVCGLLALPSNTGAVFPPQVPCAESCRGRLSVSLQCVFACL